jgi:hypothetical protein
MFYHQIGVWKIDWKLRRKLLINKLINPVTGGIDCKLAKNLRWINLIRIIDWKL